jgi:hypothetical protein
VRPKAEDAEGLVAQCLHEKRRFVQYRKSPQHSEEDRAGIDFKITFVHTGVTFDLQVKTSDNGETVGLRLPLPPSAIIARIWDELWILYDFSRAEYERVLVPMRAVV